MSQPETITAEVPTTELPTTEVAELAQREASTTKPSNYRTDQLPDKTLPRLYIPVTEELRWIIDQWANLGDAVGITEICRQAVEWLNWEDQSDHIDEMREGLYLSIDWRHRSRRVSGHNYPDKKKLQMVNTKSMQSAIESLKQKTGNKNKSEILREALMRYLMACVGEEPPVYYPGLRNRLLPAFEKITEFSLRNTAVQFGGKQIAVSPNPHKAPLRTGVMMQKKLAQLSQSQGGKTAKTA